MRFHILTLFPDMVMQGLNTSIIGNAIEQNLIEINTINIRDFTKDRGYVDAVIDPENTRQYVAAAFEMLFSKREVRPDKKHGTV